MADISSFISSLMPIDDYRFSGRLPLAASVRLSARSHLGGVLTLQGRRTGLFSQKSEGSVTTPFGGVVFHGMRSFAGGEEHVSLTNIEGGVSGQLILPKLWGVFSCFNRAKLRLSDNASLSFDVWKPSVRFQETIGRFRPHGGRTHLYKLFSRDDRDLMFQDETALAQMSGDHALLVLAGLLYFCMDPGSVADRE